MVMIGGSVVPVIDPRSRGGVVTRVVAVAVVVMVMGVRVLWLQLLLLVFGVRRLVRGSVVVLVTGASVTRVRRREEGGRGGRSFGSSVDLHVFP